MPQDYYPSGPFLERLPDKGSFDEAREDFLLDFKNVRTARAYKADLEHFWEWCSETGVEPLQPSHEAIGDYLDS